MSSHKEYLAADLRGPLLTWRSTATGAATGVRAETPPGCEIVALNLTASGVAQQFGPLGATGLFGNDKYLQRFVRIISESAGNIWYGWANSTGLLVDKNATGGGTGVAAFLASGDKSDELPAGQYIVIQPTSVGLVRIWITNGTVSP